MAATHGKTHPQERQHSDGVAGRGTECSPETGLKGRPQESQHSAAPRRETGSSAPGEEHRMFLREGSSLDGQDAKRLGELAQEQSTKPRGPTLYPVDFPP